MLVLPIIGIVDLQEMVGFGATFRVFECFAVSADTPASVDARVCWKKRAFI
jgi:hypothetical protein